MSGSFLDASRVAAAGEGQFTVEIPDGWQQGRGAFGGLVLAALARAMEACEPDRGRRLRVLTGDLCGPVPPGPSRVQVYVLRRGANQSNLRAELIHEGEVLALASAILGAARAVELPALAPVDGPPAAPDWRSVDPLQFGPLGPRFAQFYEHRNFGPLPGSSPDAPPSSSPGSSLRRAEALGFIRERALLAQLDAPALIGRLDAWWPALFSVGPMRPMATVSFTAELFVDPAELSPEEPLLHRGRIVAAHQGYCLELRELWRGDQLVALNQQTLNVIK